MGRGRGRMRGLSGGGGSGGMGVQMCVCVGGGGGDGVPPGRPPATRPPYCSSEFSRDRVPSAHGTRVQTGGLQSALSGCRVFLFGAWCASARTTRGAAEIQAGGLRACVTTQAALNIIKIIKPTRLSRNGPGPAKAHVRVSQRASEREREGGREGVVGGGGEKGKGGREVGREGVRFRGREGGREGKEKRHKLER